MVETIVALKYSVISAFLVGLVSLVGMITISFNDKLLKKIVKYSISFATGALLGASFLHLLPHLLEADNYSINSGLLVIYGFLFMYITEKMTNLYHSHGHHHAHGHHGFDHEHCNLDTRSKQLPILISIGDAIHNFIDGLIIGGVYLINIPAGIAVTISTFLHEIPMELADFALLIKAGMTKKKALLLNLIVSMTAVIGAVTAIYLQTFVPNIHKILLAIGIGNFTYIASSVLIPELFKEEDYNASVIHLIWIVIGIALMIALIPLH